MQRLRIFMLSGILAALSLGVASAQRHSSTTIVSPWLTNLRNSQIGQPEPTTVDPTTYISLRGGAMVSPDVAAVVGFDVALPTLSIGENWHGRLDLDVIIEASLANTSTAVPISINQIYYRPQTGSTDIYGGFGVGAVLGGNATFLGKLIVGTTFASRYAAELNVNFTDNETLVLLLGRFRL